VGRDEHRAGIAVSLWVWAGVAVLGGAGALARHVVDHAVMNRVVERSPGGRWEAFPWGILLVNVSGAGLLGLLAGAGPSATATLLIGVGLLGSYTTFSTWMVQTATLAGRRRVAAAAVNVLLSLALGLAAAALGAWLGARL
jgi:CrcB protein